MQPQPLTRGRIPPPSLLPILIVVVSQLLHTFGSLSGVASARATDLMERLGVSHESAVELAKALRREPYAGEQGGAAGAQLGGAGA